MAQDIYIFNVIIYIFIQLKNILAKNIQQTTYQVNTPYYWKAIRNKLLLNH